MDEPVYFAFSASLRVFGEGVPFDEISARLGLRPTITHRKGDRRVPGGRPFPHDIWSYAPPVDETRPLGEHLRALWAAVGAHTEYLKSLKPNLTVDVFCGYRSNSDTAGFEVPHEALQIFTELEVPFGVSVVIA